MRQAVPPRGWVEDDDPPCETAAMTAERPPAVLGRTRELDEVGLFIGDDRSGVRALVISRRAANAPTTRGDESLAP
jgi:hypothetical protein